MNLDSIGVFQKNTMRVRETVGQSALRSRGDDYLCVKISPRGVEFGIQGGSKDCVLYGLIPVYGTRYAVARGEHYSFGHYHISIWD